MQNLMFAFHHFDVDNSGFITEQGLKEVFHREGKKITSQQVQDMMKTADADNKGKLNFDDFVKIMKQIATYEHDS